MKSLNQVLSDFKGITKVCGIVTALKWLFFILLKLPQCIRSRNLQPADKMFGEGPIIVRAKYGYVNLLGGQIFSSIREIWVRSVYNKENFVTIPDDGIVVDLGANVGAFSMLALANSSHCKVIAVEPNAELNELFWKQIKYNNFEERVTLNRFFIGSYSAIQMEMLKNPFTTDAKSITQKEFIELHNLKKIDFLKCDIEGSEFEFISDISLLEITKQLAIEIHDHAGNRKDFIKKLTQLGFQFGPIKDDPAGCILLAKK